MKLGDEIAQRTALGEALVELGARDPRVLVLDGDCAPSTQTHLFAKRFPDRFIEVGIAEQNMAGLAAGLTTLGFVPWISAFAVFLTKRSGDQVRNSIAHPRANVKLNGSYGGLPTGRAGATHSAIEDLAVMRCMPNVTILSPGDPREVELCVRLAMEVEGPVYLRTVRCPVPVIFPEEHRIALGKAVVLSGGQDAALVSEGMMTPKARAAATLLARRGIAVRHLHMPSLKPLDAEAILDAAETTGAIVTVENHSIVGGLGSAVCEVVAERGVPCVVRRLGFRDLFLESGDDEALFHEYGVNVEEIAAAVEATVDARRRARARPLSRPPEPVEA